MALLAELSAAKMTPTTASVEPLLVGHLRRRDVDGAFSLLTTVAAMDTELVQNVMMFTKALTSCLEVGRVCLLARACAFVCRMLLVPTCALPDTQLGSPPPLLSLPLLSPSVLSPSILSYTLPVHSLPSRPFPYVLVRSMFPPLPFLLPLLHSPDVPSVS